METMYEGKVNSPATTLDGGINDAIETIDIVDGSVLPDAPNIAVIGTGEDAETILYGTKIANQLTSVTRGYQGIAKAWDTGETIARMFTEKDYANLKANIEAHETDKVETASNIGGQVGIYKQKTGMDLELRTLKVGSGVEIFNSEPTGAFDITNCVYDSVSFSVSSQETVPGSVTFSSDGSKMYIVGTENATVYQYTLSIAWDVSTASYNSVSFSVSSQESEPGGVTFSSDGSKMYIVGNNVTVFQYSLSTAWNISTASYNSVSFSVSSQETFPRGVEFSSDGSKMYIVGYGTATVYQYTLSTDWNISTAAYDSVSFDVGSQDAYPFDVTFSSDGSKMYIMGGGNDTVYQYTLSTDWNLSTASYNSVSFSVSSQESEPGSVTFSSDGSKMYIVGYGTDTVYQYTVGGTTEYDYVQIEVKPAEIPIDTLGSPTDITTLDASITAHGLLPKLPDDDTKFLDGVGAWVVPAGGDALTTDPLSQFAATTSAQLAGVISDEVGEGKAVFGVDKILGAMREQTFIHEDGTGGVSFSEMVWIPRYVTAGFTTQPNLNGINMGGFWVDKYQASQPDSTMASRGSTSANTPGAIPGVSQVLKVPWTDISWPNAKVACKNRGASNTSTASAAAAAANELTDTAHLPTYAVGRQIKITLAADGLTYIRRITAFDPAATTVYFEPDLPSNVAIGDSYTIDEYHLVTAYEWASMAYLACMIFGDKRRAGIDLPKGNNDFGKDYQDADSPENYGMRDPVEPGTGDGIDRVLTGSGPNTWSLTGHPLGVWDLNGNVWEWIDLLMGGGNSIPEVAGTDHIINPGFPEAGLTMPNSNNRIATLEDSDVNGKKAALPKTVGAAVLEYGSDRYYQNTGERAAGRGGYWNRTSDAGVLILNLSYAPSFTYYGIGFRAAR